MGKNFNKYKNHFIERIFVLSTSIIIAFIPFIYLNNGFHSDDYQYIFGVKLYNFSDQDHKIKAGSKIAQLVLYPHITANVSWAEEVTDADRGDAGFGSTDKA